MEQNDTSRPEAGEVKSGVCAEDRWRAIILQQRESGLSMAAFCRQCSIPPTSFYSWRQKLEGPRTTERARSASPRASSFVSVKLASARAARPGGMLEVRLRGGRRLRVRGPLQRDLLIELIDVLETLA